MPFHPLKMNYIVIEISFTLFLDDKRSVLESLRRATVELDYAKEREDRFSSDLEVKLYIYLNSKLED